MIEMDLPKYTGTRLADPERHDGRLEYARGASNYQVTYASRFYPEDGLGWTYNHAPDLTFWNGRFLIQYLATPAKEHVGPAASFLVSSLDGMDWTAPRISFPPYVIPACEITDSSGRLHVFDGTSCAVMHQRVGFFRFGDRLFLQGFYGFSDTPNHSPFNRYGIGRVIRELYANGSMSDIYFLRFNDYAGWRPELLNYPLYKHCEDESFTAACDALLSDKLEALQWGDEQSMDDIVPSFNKKVSAFNWYTLPDGDIAGLWKWAMTSRAKPGEDFAEPYYEPTLVMPGSKMWGERTSDGKYALVTTPTHVQNCRWPLSVMTSDDGINYGDMLLVHGEVPPQRYYGLWKSFGPQYMRGINERHDHPSDGAVWVAYSVNKEDIWISRIPCPVQKEYDRSVCDDFTSAGTDGWNIYSPRYCPVRVKGGYLSLIDMCAHDYARATRTFAPRARAELRTRLQINRAENAGELRIELCGEEDRIAAELVFDPDGRLYVADGGAPHPLCRYEIGEFYDISISADCASQRFTISLNGSDSGSFRFFYPTAALSRVNYRTGKRRYLPNLQSDPDDPGCVRDISPDSDEKKHEITVLIKSLYITEDR